MDPSVWAMSNPARFKCWLDTGSQETLLEASQFVQTLEKRQGMKISCIEEIAFRMRYIDKENLELRIKNSTEILLIHGDTDQVVPSTHLLEAKDFLIRNNVEIETHLIKNCDHHIPIQASSIALNYILKKF